MGTHRPPMDSHHKGPVIRKTFHADVDNPYTVYPKKYAHGFALLCFVVVIHWMIYPYPSGLLHWHCGNLTIAPVPAKQPWWIWINTSFEFIMNDYITTTKQSTTKPCAYFMGYTVWRIPTMSATFSWELRINMESTWQQQHFREISKDDFPNINGNSVEINKKWNWNMFETCFISKYHIKKVTVRRN